MAEVLEQFPEAVVATGGGSVLREQNRRRIREFGDIVWLTALPDELARRLVADDRSRAGRPALTPAGAIEEIAQVLCAAHADLRGAGRFRDRDRRQEPRGGCSGDSRAACEPELSLTEHSFPSALRSTGAVPCSSTGPCWRFWAAGFFLIGTVVGSFLNVCIYRIPWQKSVIWPQSRCPRCLAAIAGFDNIPIVSWIALRGECRRCGLPISARYPIVEALTGLLFLGAYLVDVIAAPRGAWGQIPTAGLAAAAYHSLFLALLVAAA